MFEKDAKIMVWMFFGPAIAGGFLAAFIPRFGPWGILGIVLAVVGSYLVIKAKVTQKMRTKVLVEWGAKNMTPQEKKRYYLGYAMLALSIVAIGAQRVFLFY